MTLMDLLAIDTCVPAVTARGAIVEKGQKRCKAIGDYLNNIHHYLSVGAGLLAMAYLRTPSLASQLLQRGVFQIRTS
jgi:hypothetical protein